MDIFILPLQGTGKENSPIIVKYSELMERSRIMPHGADRWCFCSCTCTIINRQIIINKSDTFLIPDPYDTPILSRKNSVITLFNNLFIPSDWIIDTTTWRDILRYGMRSCQIMQRFNGLRDNKPVILRDLDIVLKQMPLIQRSRIITAISSLKIDINDIDENYTLRKLIKIAIKKFRFVIPEAEQ